MKASAILHYKRRGTIRRPQTVLKHAEELLHERLGEGDCFSDLRDPTIPLHHAYFELGAVDPQAQTIAVDLYYRSRFHWELEQTKIDDDYLKYSLAADLMDRLHSIEAYNLVAVVSAVVEEIDRDAEHPAEVRQWEEQCAFFEDKRPLPTAVAAEHQQAADIRAREHHELWRHRLLGMGLLPRRLGYARNDWGDVLPCDGAPERQHNTPAVTVEFTLRAHPLLGVRFFSLLQRGHLLSAHGTVDSKCCQNVSGLLAKLNSAGFGENVEIYDADGRSCELHLRVEYNETELADLKRRIARCDVVKEWRIVDRKNPVLEVL